MKRALVIQHMNYDHPGRFLDFFAEDNIVPEMVRIFEGAEIPNLTTYDLMFVLGGAQNTWQEDRFPYLAAEKAAIREWVQGRAKPYLGVCLGHQLLATALEGDVDVADQGEVGVCQVEVETTGLFAGLLPHQTVMQWHHAEVKRVPIGAKVLASSPACNVQAMAIDAHALSTQFHCEFSPQTIATWSSIPSYISVLEEERGAGAYERLKAECFPLMPEMARQTKMMWDNFKKQSGLI